MDNEKQIVNVLEAFLHDVVEGESDVSEITNMLGYNELKVLLKLAKKGLSDPISLPTIKPGDKVRKCPHCEELSTDHDWDQSTENIFGNPIVRLNESRAMYADFICPKCGECSDYGLLEVSHD